MDIPAIIIAIYITIGGIYFVEEGKF